MERNIFFREDNLLTAIGKGVSDRLISCLHCLARIATATLTWLISVTHVRMLVQDSPLLIPLTPQSHP